MPLCHVTGMTKAPVYKAKTVPVIQTIENVVALGGTEQVAKYSAGIISFVGPARAPDIFHLDCQTRTSIKPTGVTRRQKKKKAHASLQAFFKIVSDDLMFFLFLWRHQIGDCAFKHLSGEIYGF